MRPALALLTCIAAASCASSANAPAAAQAPSMPAPAEAPQPRPAPADAPPADEILADATISAPTVAEVECVDQLPDRVRVRFDAGHTARDIAVWYATTACRPVEASRALLTRSALVEVNAIVGRGELFDFLVSLLADLGLAADEVGDTVTIVAPAGDDSAGGDRLVLAPIEEGASDEEAAAEETAGEEARETP